MKFSLIGRLYYQLMSPMAALAQVGAVLVPKTVGSVIINHTSGLHMRVQDGRADESEAALFHILAQCVRDRAGGRHLPHGLPMVLYWLVVYKSPDILRKAAARLLHLQKGTGIFTCAIHFQPIADDSGIQQQFFQLFIAVTSYLSGVEIVKQLSVVFPLAQDGDPRQSRLGTFQNQELEQGLVVPHRYAPLIIMIGNVERVIPAPGTSFCHFLSLVIVEV